MFYLKSFIGGALFSIVYKMIINLNWCNFILVGFLLLFGTIISELLEVLHNKKTYRFNLYSLHFLCILFVCFCYYYPNVLDLSLFISSIIYGVCLHISISYIIPYTNSIFITCISIFTGILGVIVENLF